MIFDTVPGPVCTRCKRDNCRYWHGAAEIDIMLALEECREATARLNFAAVHIALALVSRLDVIARPWYPNCSQIEAFNGLRAAVRKVIRWCK